MDDWSESISDAAGSVSDSVSGDDSWSGPDSYSDNTPTGDTDWVSNTEPPVDPVAAANAAYDAQMAVSGAANSVYGSVIAPDSFAMPPPDLDIPGPPIDEGIYGPNVWANQSITVPFGNEMRTTQYDKNGSPIFNWNGINAPAVGNQTATYDEWLAANPNYQRDTGWTPWWGYNEYQANINPMINEMERMFTQYGSYPSLRDVPEWILNQPAGSPLNALTYTPPPIQEGTLDYERMIRDLNNYGKAFNVGGASSVLPGGWTTFGPGGSFPTGGLNLKEQEQPWYVQWMEGRGYVWNPYGGYFEYTGYGDPDFRGYTATPQPPPAARRGGGGGGGGGGYTSVPPLELRPGTPEYEAYFSRMPRINNVEWMPGR